MIASRVVALRGPAEDVAGLGQGTPLRGLVLGRQPHDGAGRGQRHEPGHEVDGVAGGLVEAAHADQAEPVARIDAGLLAGLAQRRLPGGLAGLDVAVHALPVAGEAMIGAALQQQHLKPGRGLAQQVDADQAGLDAGHQRGPAVADAVIIAPTWGSPHRRSRRTRRTA